MIATRSRCCLAAASGRLFAGASRPNRPAGRQWPYLALLLVMAAGLTPQCLAHAGHEIEWPDWPQWPNMPHPPPYPSDQPTDSPPSTYASPAYPPPPVYASPAPASPLAPGFISSYPPAYPPPPSYPSDQPPTYAPLYAPVYYPPPAYPPVFSPNPDMYQVRLVDGPDPSVGRVEIFNGTTWGTVCDDYFSRVEATVVCKEMGFAAGVPLPLFGLRGGGRGTKPILMDDVDCSGSKPRPTRLYQCNFNGWGVHNCNHEEDVWVRCFYDDEDMAPPPLYYY